MPENVKSVMGKYLPDGRSGLLKLLYSSPAPNQFLATFAEIAVPLKEDAWIQDLVKNRFSLFLKHHLLPLEPIGSILFVGSIGCIFADLIENELANHALKAGSFLKDPTARLFTMHNNHEIEE